VQVLRESWDVANKKWFYVTPPDVTDERIEPGDPLHWTGIAQNWNTTCADCHSTDVHKGYDSATNTYHTTFKEINVSCEECHGPGSVHVELAR
jgi:nitrate/TMAO reductase-like tetraheme cytochrome c subunit